ncbi:MAG TPA: hypothetical protein VNQ76_07335 [Planctomicrobium sp.]|nr:hypothetical protein [Planctomicrobium sp.]
MAEIELLTQAHPTVPRNQIEKVVSEKKRIYRDQELGYNTGVATATYWRQLGYQPNQPVWWYGYAVEESNLAPVYSKSALQEVDDERSPDDVWADYYNRHGSREIALAEILRFSNRLQKVIRHPGFYLLKDYWITLNQEYLREGRISRQERKECWSCNGTGQFRYDSCRKCDGTGVYSKRKLYEHRFDIQGREYCFHSYREPQNITDTPGADLGFYGGAFQASELPLPPQSLLVRAVRIGLVEIFGGPVPEADVRRNERWRYSIFWSEE